MSVPVDSTIQGRGSFVLDEVDVSDLVDVEQLGMIAGRLRVPPAEFLREVA